MKSIIFNFIAIFSLCFSAQAELVKEAAQLNNDIGLDFVQAVADNQYETKPGKNIMFSPISYYMAISMAYNGTSNGTRDYFQGFYQNKDFVTVNQANKALFDAANMTRPADCKSCPKLGIYNSLWNTTEAGKFDFAPAYLASMKDSYGATHKAMDFKSPEAANTINAWANEKTQGLIPKVIDADAMQKLMWIIMNATYLEASWSMPFYPMPAEDQKEFTKLDGSKVQPEMITQEENITILALDGFQVAEIPFYTPYGADMDLQYYILLPHTPQKFHLLKDSLWDERSLDTMLKYFADPSLSTDITSQKTNVVMPKYSFGSTVELKKDSPIVEAMGMKFLFENTADFSAMSTPESVPTKVGLIKQDTKIELDEKGVKAAAVTLIAGAESTSIIDIPVQVRDFIVDKPFHFVIASKATGTVFFAGSVFDPTQK